LREVGDAVEAEIVFHPFELNPHMPPDGENVGEHIQKKYGSPPERSTTARQALTERGAELGFQFNCTSESRIWNTFDAHRLLHWAGLEGKQLALKEALFAENFTEQRSTSDPEVLAAAAERAGLDPVRARAIIASDDFKQDVRREEAFWTSRGVQAVPTIIFNARWALQGGQPPEVFARVIRDIMSGAVKEAPA